MGHPDPHFARRGRHPRASSRRIEVHADLAFLGVDPPYTYASAFSNILAKNAKSSGPVTAGEHHAFLMYFFNSTKSFCIVKELSIFVHLLQIGQKYVWGNLFLALLYKSMDSFLRKVEDKVSYAKAEGPFLFLQLWAQLYFPKFAPDLSTDSSEVLGCALAATPNFPLERVEALRVLMDIDPYGFCWCPSLEKGLDPKWIFTP